MSQVIQEIESVDAASIERPRGFIRRLLRERPQASIGLGMVILLALVGIFAPLIAPYEPLAAGPLRAAPSAQHWLGTDDAGHDMLTLIMYGIRVSLLVGFAAAAVSMLIGGSAGIAAGYFGRKTDSSLMRVADFFLVVPELILMVILAKLIGRGLHVIILVIGLLLWAQTARVVRAQVKSVKERVYVKRAYSLGAGSQRIVFRHVLPQVTPLLVALGVLAIALAIFDETFLSFLGLGDPATISLGKLIENAFEASASTRGEWWMIIPPGVAVTLLILGFTLFGQALEDALNPRLKVSYLSSRSWRVKRRSSEQGSGK
ncbi:MAG: ABC transporter permease [Actinomycetota bacterium]